MNIFGGLRGKRYNKNHSLNRNSVRRLKAALSAMLFLPSIGSRNPNQNNIEKFLNSKTNPTEYVLKVDPDDFYNGPKFKEIPLAPDVYYSPRDNEVNNGVIGDEPIGVEVVENNGDVHFIAPGIGSNIEFSEPKKISYAREARIAWGLKEGEIEEREVKSVYFDGISAEIKYGRDKIRCTVMFDKDENTFSVWVGDAITGEKITDPNRDSYTYQEWLKQVLEWKIGKDEIDIEGINRTLLRVVWELNGKVALHISNFGWGDYDQFYNREKPDKEISNNLDDETNETYEETPESEYETNDETPTPEDVVPEVDGCSNVKGKESPEGPTIIQTTTKENPLPVSTLPQITYRIIFTPRPKSLDDDKTVHGNKEIEEIKSNKSRKEELEKEIASIDEQIVTTKNDIEETTYTYLPDSEITSYYATDSSNIVKVSQNSKNNSKINVER